MAQPLDSQLPYQQTLNESEVSHESNDVSLQDDSDHEVKSREQADIEELRSALNERNPIQDLIERKSKMRVLVQIRKMEARRLREMAASMSDAEQGKVEELRNIVRELVEETDRTLDKWNAKMATAINLHKQLVTEELNFIDNQIERMNKNKATRKGVRVKSMGPIAKKHATGVKEKVKKQ
jgi:multidrug efflux pump subunit AcrB